MKKEIKSYEELLKCHLKPFEAEFNGEKIFGTIKIDELGMRFELTEESKVKVGLSAFTGFKRWIESNFYNFRLSNFLYNIIVEVDKWQPKFGELVLSYDSESGVDACPNIFLFEKNGVYHCVSDHGQDIKEFNSSEIYNEYSVFKFRFVKQIEQPKNIEISLEEAKEIIAKEKGVNVEQVNLNFNIK